VFYDNFMQLCQSKGVTPTKVARDIGILQSTVSMWKKQGTTPRYDTLKKLAKYFGVSVNDLLSDSEKISEALDIAAHATYPDLSGQTQTFQSWTQTDELLLRLGGFSAVNEFYNLSDKDKERALEDIRSFAEYVIKKYKQQADEDKE